MNYPQGQTYAQIRANIYWLIDLYGRDILKDPGIAALSLDDIERLYQHDQEMLDNYRGDLLLLEANHILNLI